MRFGSRDTLVTSPKLNPVEFIRAYWKQHELLKSAPETTTNSVRRPHLMLHAPLSPTHRRLQVECFSMVRMAYIKRESTELALESARSQESHPRRHRR